MKKNEWMRDWWVKVDDDPTAVDSMNEAVSKFGELYPALAEGKANKIMIRRGRNIFLVVEPRVIDGKRYGYVITANGKKNIVGMANKELWKLLAVEKDEICPYSFKGYFYSLKEVVYRLITDIQYELSVKQELKRRKA